MNLKVRPKVPERIPEGWWAWAQERDRPQKPHIPVVREYTAVVRDVSHVDATSAKGAAFIEAGGDRILLQLGATNHNTNAKALPVWAAAWRRNGVAVDGWWRISHNVTNSDPPPVLGVDGWWPNAESADEYGRLPVIYQTPCRGLLTLGKAPGAWPPPGGILGAECFRDSPTADHTVANSIDFWVQSGLDVGQLMIMIQSYGTPFAPPVEQARQAVELGASRICVYTLDEAKTEDIIQIGAMIA